MTPKITRSEARSMFRKIYACGYNYLQSAGVRDNDRVGYNCGLYGWNWDLIPIGNNVAICTGYRPNVGGNLPEWFVKKFEPLNDKYYRAYNSHDPSDVEVAKATQKKLAALVRKLAKEA